MISAFDPRQTKLSKVHLGLNRAKMFHAFLSKAVHMTCWMSRLLLTWYHPSGLTVQASSLLCRLIGLNLLELVNILSGQGILATQI